MLCGGRLADENRRRLLLALLAFVRLPVELVLRARDIRETSITRRLNRAPEATMPGSVNPITGKPAPGVRKADGTINHQLSVLFGFYEWACASDLGPLVNPVPAQRSRSGGRVDLHRHPEPICPASTR
jgi:hypothetical protein